MDSIRASPFNRVVPVPALRPNCRPAQALALRRAAVSGTDTIVVVSCVLGSCFLNRASVGPSC
jgi:hypothetical protein